MSTRTIPLTQGQVAIVDEEDFERLSRFKWQATWNPRSKTFYASRRDGILMHRSVMGAAPDVLVDHRDHDGLNNRKLNLRLCTAQQNSQNQRKRKQPVGSRSPYSQYKGVHWFQSGTCKHWGASIRAYGTRIHLGLHLTEEEAARAYDKAARQFFGEFAHLNFP